MSEKAKHVFNSSIPVSRHFMREADALKALESVAGYMLNPRKIHDK
jgi:hypothetical protein